MISFKASLAKMIESPIKIKTKGVKVSFILVTNSIKTIGIWSIVYPKKSMPIEINKTRLMGSVKTLFKIEITCFVESSFFPCKIVFAIWLNNRNFEYQNDCKKPKDSNNIK